MWQVLLAAAIAGSTSLVAKRFFFNPFSSLSPDSDDHSTAQEPLTPPFRIGFLDSGFDDDGVFRFSSSGSVGHVGSGSGSKKSYGVKSRGRIRELKKKKKKGLRGDEIEKESGRRRGFVCLKKRRTIKKNDTAGPKRGLCSYDQDSSAFRSALGVCIMYMMSAGIKEINKLKASVEENIKVVQELKAELFRRKSSRNHRVLGSTHSTNTISMKSSEKSGQVDLNRSDMTSRGSRDPKPISIPLSDDTEYASSVLTEEPEPEMVEMDWLEMELESELQKLTLTQPDELMEGYNGSESYQYGGVSPLELDKKLSHLLIEQQEGHINELEAKLQTAQSKLQDKEAELQALKNCVRHFTDFSMSASSSDDELDQDQDQNLFISWKQQNQTDDNQIKPIIGTKRPS